MQTNLEVQANALWSTQRSARNLIQQGKSEDAETLTNTIKFMAANSDNAALRRVAGTTLGSLERETPTNKPLRIWPRFNGGDDAA